MTSNVHLTWHWNVHSFSSATKCHIHVFVLGARTHVIYSILVIVWSVTYCHITHTQVCSTDDPGHQRIQGVCVGGWGLGRGVGAVAPPPPPLPMSSRPRAKSVVVQSLSDLGKTGVTNFYMGVGFISPPPPPPHPPRHTKIHPSTPNPLHAPPPPTNSPTHLWVIGETHLYDVTLIKEGNIQWLTVQVEWQSLIHMSSCFLCVGHNFLESNYYVDSPSHDTQLCVIPNPIDWYTWRFEVP